MGTTAEKLKYLNETKAEIKNALETPYNVMRDYPELIKKYIDNQPTKVVTDGICGNAVDVPVKTIETNGNIRQETTEGYNLLNVPVEYTVLSTGAYKKVPISLKANHTYTIKIGQINTDNTDVTRVLFNFMYNEVEISNSYAYVKLSDLKGIYTPASDVDAVFIYSGDSYAQGAKTNTTYKNLMIYEGTEDKPYEPYTGGIPSPSPDYPQEITNVGENGIKIKQSGKNLFDELYYSNKILYKKENRYFAAVEMPDSFKTKFYGNGFLKGTDKDLVFGFSNSNLSISNRILSNHVLNKNVEYDFTNADKVYFVIGNGNEINIDIDIDTIFSNYNIMVTTTEVTSYEPYHEPIITPINLQGNVLSKAGDVKDILKIRRNGEVEIKKNVGKVTFVGDDTYAWNISNSSITGLNAFWILISKYKQLNWKQKAQTKLSNYFKYYKEEWKQVTEPCICENIDLKPDMCIFSGFDSNMSLTKWKEWLSQHPTEVYYELDTPQTIILPSISPIELWQGTNIFSLVTNLDTDFEVEYVVDKDSVTKEEE